MTENNAKLLEINYESQLESLREIGLLKEGERVPLSDIADYMKWAGGLLDVQLAKVEKSTGKLVLMSTSEWDGMSSNLQGNYLTIGVRVRAEGRDFLISKSDVQTSDGAYTMKWSNEVSDVVGLRNYGTGSTGMYEDFDAKGMTDAIVAYANARGVEYLAGELSRGYKACTVGDDGVDDPVEWSLATIAHLRLMSKYRKEINAVISTYIGSTYVLQSDVYWSATEHSNYYAYRMHLGSGVVNNNYNKNNYNFRVRSVSAL